MEAQTIKLRRQDVYKLIRDLNVLVVSLDRIGSAFFDDPTQQACATDKFLRDVLAFKLLAKARRMLCEAYESQLGGTEMERLEERLDKVKVWGEKGFNRERKRHGGSV
jgi:hypothetical protein